MGADFGHLLPDGAALRSDIPTAPTTGAGPCWACQTGNHTACVGSGCYHCPPANHQRDGWPHTVTHVGSAE